MNRKPLALIVEDNEDQNMIFTTALERAGYTTESILDGSLAQKRLRETTPAAVVLDLHIPGITGDMLLSQIRSDRRLRNVIVILATADDRRAEELRSIADLVLLKPVSFSQLSVLADRFRNRPHL